jgi:hypothetical protein
MTSHPRFKLGRLHRTYDPRIPHLSALIAGQPPLPLPDTVDWTRKMPDRLGMMLNDALGDCTCAAFYHALQVWSFNANPPIDTEPDDDVKQLYVLACGYNPRVPGEGPGGNEQHVLTYLLRKGAPPACARRSRFETNAAGRAGWPPPPRIPREPRRRQAHDL